MSSTTYLLSRVQNEINLKTVNSVPLRLFLLNAIQLNSKLQQIYS